MKKVLTLVAVASMFSLVACGPSEEEKAKLEAEAKAKMDSLFNAASQSISTAIDSAATTATEAVTEPAKTEAPATEEHH